MMKNIPYYLTFSYFYGIGPMRFAALVKRFSDVKNAYEASQKDIAETIGVNWAQKFAEFRARFDPVKKMEELKKKGISVIPFGSSIYPHVLEQIPDPPICLYAKGDADSIFNLSTQFLSHESLHTKTHDLESEKLAFDLSINNESIFFAIVGTRTPSPYGIQITRKFAAELAEAGFIIVSGMALGIDSIAHWAALDAGKTTIAVLGCGVDIIYPASNRKLYDEICARKGLVISEFPPETMVEKGFFIARNRIISGLSKGVLIIEGLKDSGALITARYAAEQGKEVFAAPGPITSPLSQAPHLLLKQGAKLVTSAEDIYEELGLQMVPKKKEDIEIQLNEVEKTIFWVLQKEPLLVDEIAGQMHKPINQILDIISVLELRSIIEKNSEGRYQVKL